MIPVGFGFGLAVYLKRVYENPTPRPDVHETSSASEDILDILKESSVAQDILLAKNKNWDEESNQPISDENMLGESLQENSVPTLEKQTIEPQSGFKRPDQDAPLAETTGNPHEFLPGNTDSGGLQTFGEEPRRENNPVAEMAETLYHPVLESNIDEISPDIMEIVRASSASKDIRLAKHKILEEESKSMDTEENFLAEPSAEKTKQPEEEAKKETNPKITKKTFENIPVYGAVPEELLETHLCLDQIPLSDTANSDNLEVYDSFAVVPDSLLHTVEVDSPPGAGQFVQTQDAAIAIRRGKKRREERE